MAAKVKEKQEEKQVSPAEQAMAFLSSKENKDDHYNFEETIDYQVPSSSILLNSKIDGGIRPGAVRFVGVTGGGKTSSVLDFLYHFLNGGENRYGLYVKSEGRLSDNMIKRSGITFTSDPTKWVPGTCFILESNVYETVFGFIGDLIRSNTTKAKYFGIIDSMDMLGKKDDLAKPLTEAGQVAGGSLLTSVFLKKTSAALAKRGHILAFLSQVRDEIKINAYGPAPTPRQGKSSGGHALEHAPNWVFDFQPRFQDDIIRENPNDKKSKIKGHYCNIRLLKTDNEKTLEEVRYPICYGRADCNSVWVEKEVADGLLEWGLLSRAGAWYSFADSLREEVKALDPDIPEKFQGFDAVNAYLEAHKDVVGFLAKKMTVVL